MRFLLFKTRFKLIQEPVKPRCTPNRGCHDHMIGILVHSKFESRTISDWLTLSFWKTVRFQLRVSWFGCQQTWSSRASGSVALFVHYTRTVIIVVRPWAIDSANDDVCKGAVVLCQRTSYCCLLKLFFAPSNFAFFTLKTPFPTFQIESAENFSPITNH